MKSFLECVPCMIRQVDEIGGRLFAGNEAKKKTIHDQAAALLKEIDIKSMTPPEATALVHKAIAKTTGIKDLYKDIKKENNKLALSLYPRLKQIKERAADKLLASIRLSIAGNIIDYGAHSVFDVDSSIEDAMSKNFTVDDYGKFKIDVQKAGNILYIGDNAGEIVFDKLLVEELMGMGKEVIFAVKSGPVLNDALMQDAIDVSMTKTTKVIESGSDIAGTLTSSATKEFKKAYRESDLVIAKGQGNLETIEDDKKNIYFLLMCKCGHLAQRLKCSKNAIILLNNSNKRYHDFLREDLCVV